MNDLYIMKTYVVGTVLLLLLLILVIYVFFAQRAFNKAHTEQHRRLRLELENKELVIGFEEREMMRTEISREIHDNITQTSNFLRMSLHALESICTTDRQQEIIKRAGGLTDKMLQNINHLSHSMNTGFIKHNGLVGSLQYDFQHIEDSSHLKCYLKVQGDPQVLSAEKQLMTYRIAQQAILNILKHAKAYTIETNLSFSPEKCTVEIKDDGEGFSVETGFKKGRLGLENMKHRARLLSGIMDIKSTNKGTTVRVEFVPGEKPEEFLPTPANPNSLYKPFSFVCA